MTRAEILEEFGSAACENECEAGDCISERKMADEILRLRTQLAELNADRDLTFRIAEHNGQEAIKANAILERLRNPSDRIIDAVTDAYLANKLLQDLVRAAVSAAEQEVGDV